MNHDSRFLQHLLRTAACGSALALGGVMPAWPAASNANAANDYPSHPIRIIVPNTGGSQMDSTTRAIGQHLTTVWGQQVVVDDRPGAGGIIGHELAAKSPPDGYTLMLTAAAGAVILPLMSKVPYDMARDFDPVSLVLNSVQVLSVHPSVPASTVPELLAVARARPGQLNCGSSGTGSTNHLTCAMLSVMGKVDIVHVPFKGTVPQMVGIVSGQAQMGFASIPSTMTFVRSGKLRALAQGGATRSPVLPDMPTIAETLPGYQATTWYAMYAPRGTPAPIVAKLQAEIARGLREPATVKHFAEQGLDVQPSTPAELTSYMQAETTRFARVIKEAGIVTER